MPIVQTVVKPDDYTQRDGSRYVMEYHTDNLGVVWTVGPYLTQPGFDYNARAQQRAQELSNQLAEQEVDGELNGVGA